ncbi:MAG: OmpH family outer membrane protein [Oceanicaulis sp.]
MSRTLIAAVAGPVRAIAAVLVLGAGFAGAAQAQSVLVMNEEQILTESAAGQHISTEIQRIRDNASVTLEQRTTALTAESEALNAETSALSESALQQRQDLQERFQNMATESVELEVERAVLRQELIATQQAALQPVLEALQAVLQEIVDERQAAVLVDRSQVVYASDAANITQDAIARLNARIAQPTVSRVRLNDEQRAAVRQQVVQQFVAQQRRLQQLQAQQAAAQQQ